ncbi:MAG: hypothetical protein U0Q16_09935 [Bryobacteraceae bacterium]
MQKRLLDWGGLRGGEFVLQIGIFDWLGGAVGLKLEEFGEGAVKLACEAGFLAVEGSEGA